MIFLNFYPNENPNGKFNFWSTKIRIFVIVIKFILRIFNQNFLILSLLLSIFIAVFNTHKIGSIYVNSKFAFETFMEFSMISKKLSPNYLE